MLIGDDAPEEKQITERWRTNYNQMCMSIPNPNPQGNVKRLGLRSPYLVASHGYVTVTQRRNGRRNLYLVTLPSFLF